MSNKIASYLPNIRRAVAALMFISVILFPSFVRASSASSWLDIGHPVLSQPESIAPALLPKTVGDYGNIDCHEHTFITRPSIPLVQTEQSHTACAVTTKYGEVDPSGYIQLNGTNVAGKVQTAAGSQVYFMPAPNSDTAVVMVNLSSGAEILFYNNVSKNFSSTSKTLDGEVTYKLAQQPDHILKDQNGNIIYLRAASIGFSTNGKWLVADWPHVATVRVDMATYDVVPFQNPYNYDNGSDPQTQTAITDDGQYAATTSRSGSFQITDLSTCGIVPGAITGPVNCQATNSTPFLQQDIPSYLWSIRPRFINTSLMSFYALYDLGNGTRAVSKYRIAPPGSTIQDQYYLALGDSYSAGQGTYDYFPETDTGKSLNDCHTSPVSYPYLIGQQLQLSSYHNVACSGARIQDIITSQKPNVPPNNTLGELLPGLKPQLQYVQENNPNVITLSIVGNDIGFGAVLNSCISYSLAATTCYATYEDRFEKVTQINVQFNRLVDSYQKIKNTSKPDSKIYVFGYPEIARNDGDCAVNVRLNNDEIKFSNLLISYINSVVETAANKAGVRYVDVTNAFAGHKLCETVSSDVAINGVSAGADLPLEGIGPVAGESYHPNKLGHQLYKDKILEQTSNFTQSMPVADPNAALPAVDDTLTILQGIPKTGRSINNIETAEEITNDSAIVGDATQIQADGTRYSLKPNSSYSLEIHSDPINLGTFNTDNYGNLSASIAIPDSVDPGFHVLHIYGQNLAGEDIDLQKTIYVAASSTDYDGDGIPNDSDSCPTLTQSGQDQDKDGVDDACDGFINKAPADTPPPPVYHHRFKGSQLQEIIQRILTLITKILWFLR